MPHIITLINRKKTMLRQIQWVNYQKTDVNDFWILLVNKLSNQIATNNSFNKSIEIHYCYHQSIIMCPCRHNTTNTSDTKDSIEMNGNYAMLRINYRMCISSLKPKSSFCQGEGNLLISSLSIHVIKYVSFLNFTWNYF